MDYVQESVENMIGDALETATGEPVVTVPGSVLEEVSAAIDDAATPVRAVVPDDTLETARWVPRGRLADAVAAGSRLRTAPVDGLVVVGEGVAATVDGTATPPTAWIDDTPSEAVVQAYADVWNAASETTFEAARASAVRDAVETIGGETARADLRALIEPVRDDVPEPIAVAVWAAAGASPRLRELTGVVADRLDCTERTVQNRIERLCEYGLLGRTHDTTDGPGRPETVVVRHVDPPVGRAVQEAFRRVGS